MATTTTHYGLTKPATNDYYDIGIPNGNMDIIDAQMKANADSAAAAQNTADEARSNLTALKHAVPVTTGGTGSALTASVAGLTLSDGVTLRLKLHTAISAGTTLNVNGSGAVSILNNKGAAIIAGAVSGSYLTVIYNGSNFILQGEGGGGTATADKILSGYTATVDTGLVTGTIPSKSAQTYTPGTSNQTISAGQYLSGVQTIAGDEDLLSANIKSGATIFGVAGNSKVVDTSAGDAAAGDILSGKKAFVDGAQITGTISSKSAQTYTPGTSDQTVSAGQYLSGAQTISGDSDLIAANIKSGVNIFGVTGTSVPRQTANGTVTSSSDTKGFSGHNFYQGNSGTYNMYYVTISVGFTPKFIIIYNTSEHNFTFYAENIDMTGFGANDSIFYADDGGGMGIYARSLASTDTDVSIGSTCVLPVGSTSTSYGWYAVG